MALVYSSCSPPSSIHSSRKTSWAPSGLLAQSSASLRSITPVRFETTLPPDLNAFVIDGFGGLDGIDSSSTSGLAFQDELIDPNSNTAGVVRLPSKQTDDVAPKPKDLPILGSKRPFHRWMKSLHRRAQRRKQLPSCADTGDGQQNLDAEEESQAGPSQRHGHRASSSGSSFGLISAVRSASVSLSSVSAVTRSRRNTIRSQAISRTDRSSRASMSCPRASEESALDEEYPLIDAATIDRSLQRRRILEEMISTEESYIGDVRFLINVYITMLAPLPTLPAGLRTSINQNLTEIVELHEEILGELHKVVPHSEYNQLDGPLPTAVSSRPLYCGHRRLNSLDAVPEDNAATKWLRETPGMICEPQVAAEVSRIFGKKINRFFIYKEYGAKYEMMMKDITLAQRTMPEWDSYQKGLEILASTLGTVRSKEVASKKSLSIGDLLVKPIQRVCKYPLLFAELLKYTPFTDCPNSHMEVEAVLIRLREATGEINRATNDTRMKTTLEKTWLLQDRLVFMNRKLDAVSKNQIRSFGHIRLCGALYLCWQTKNGIDGQYVICLLYRDVLCFASAGRVEPIYTILACIDLRGTKVEEADNGRGTLGLQCHTAPFSWKLVFECDHQLHEVIMAACTAKEEMEWRARLANPTEESHSNDCPILGTLHLGIKSLGTVFGKPGTIARRLSIHRATTVGPRSQLCQVILKNTSAVRDTSSAGSAALTINRSQSLLTTNYRVAILAPPRSERARLEALLGDVWTRDVLPYPGMATRSRSEHLVRSSASSMMRKLSVASIASSFTRRSGSTGPRQKLVEPEAIRDASKRSKSHDTSDNNTASDAAPDADIIVTDNLPCTSGKSVTVHRPLTPENMELSEVLGTIRYRDKAKHEAEDKDMLILRASSSNSLHLSQSLRSKKSASFSLKENLYRQGDNKACESSCREARGTVARDLGKGHGFRSLFR
ncbi:Phosphatidylinositol 3,4,5-trisphosphate-dependent Rac exchanger 1 protein [Paramyrothecium foliicola]|nr:Phosphatidylinositol 3,4,5-trisphosphate-dependent Rac exchanger 1 protein [Paramyrothecium foliicola]